MVSRLQQHHLGGTLVPVLGMLLAEHLNNITGEEIKIEGKEPVMPALSWCNCPVTLRGLNLGKVPRYYYATVADSYCVILRKSKIGVELPVIICGNFPSHFCTAS